MINYAISATTVVIGLCCANAALANGLFENRPWQFETANEKIANSATTDLIERKKGGFFDSFDNNTTINNDVTTTIEGDQINCNVASSAVGNNNANDAVADVASPAGVTDANIYANAIGNESITDQTSGDIGGSGSQLVDLGQSNVDSPQDADVTNSDIFSSIGTQQLNGTNDQVLNNDQANIDTSIGSTISDSTACLNP